MSNQTTQVGFGGGCHWCTEAVFSSLRGVSVVRQGFIKSDSPNNQYSEAVLIDVDEQQISLYVLIEIHLRTHASTSAHSMRVKYRSAVYVKDETMALRCTTALETLQLQFDKPLVTKVLALVEFKYSSDDYINYYATNPERPFCVNWIEPKLHCIKKRFSKHCKSR